MRYHPLTLQMTQTREVVATYAKGAVASRVTYSTGGLQSSALHVAITDAIDKAKLLLGKIDEQWPVSFNNHVFCCLLRRGLR